MQSSFKEKILLISFTAIVLVMVLNYSDIYGLIERILSSMNSLFIAALLAFILNVPMKKLEDQVEKISFLQSFKRSLAIVGVLTGFVIIVTGLVVIVLPTLMDTVSQLVTVSRTTIPNLINNLLDFLQDKGLLTGQLGEQVTQLLGQLKDVTMLSSVASSLLAGLVSNVSGVFSNAMTLVMAFFLTLAILSSKEQLLSILQKLLHALFSETVVARLSYVGDVVVETYDRFLMSQIVEACIIGSLVFVSYSLTGIPHASMAGILAGVLSFVPYLGPFSACLISALFVAVQSPWLALWSILLFQLIQLLEGNVIYPRVVGKSVGLPPLFTLVAALVGGNLFGLLGMIFFTPVVAVVYRLTKEWVSKRLKRKQVPLKE